MKAFHAKEAFFAVPQVPYGMVHPLIVVNGLILRSNTSTTGFYAVQIKWDDWALTLWDWRRRGEGNNYICTTSTGYSLPGGGTA